ncbi:unnamed protein product, partial [Brenthis ino]
MLVETLVSKMYYIIWTLLLLFCLHCILWSLFWKARRNFKNLPSYSQLPFLGSIHWFIGGGAKIFRRLKELSKIMDDRRLPFVVWLGPQPLLLISDPEDVKTVTNGFLDKPYLYDFGRDWLGNGLVIAPGEVWKRNIKLIAGMFTGSMVDGFQPAFNIKARELVEKLKEENNKQPFDAMPHLSYITLAAICQTGLGVTYTSDSKKSQEYYEAFKSALELLTKRGLNLFHHYDYIYRFSSDHAKFVRNVAVMHNLSNTVINQKIQERKKMSKTHTDSTIEGPKKASFKTVLDVLLDLKEIDPNMDENQIRSEVHTIIVGGQETVAATLGYVMLMLGSHPDVQNKLYNEVKQIFEGNKSDLTKEDLSSLVYCEAVIQETLRLYPPIPVVTRHADRDLQIKSCTIPKGTLCSLNLWGAGRSHRAWGEDADKFLPERWLLPWTSSNLAYMPFSIGRRSCIGKRYATAILKTLLAHCVKDLIFASEADKLEFQMDIGLRAIKGNLLEVKLRMYYIIWTLLLLFCLHCILWSLFWKARRNFKNLLSYSQLPFLGSVHWFIGGGATIFRRLKEISKIMDDKRLPFIFWLGPQPVLLISDPEDVRTVSNGFLEKPYFYDFGRAWLGTGLVVAPGHIWKRNIKLIAGMFTGSMVDGFQQVFNIKARELVEKLKEENNKRPFDPMPHLSYITLAAICQTGLGVTYTSDSKQSLEYYEAFNSILELILKRALNLFYYYDCIYRFSSDHAKFLRNVAVMHNLSNTVINQKIQERKEIMGKTHTDSTIEGPKKASFKTVLDVLLDLKEIDPNMDENQIRSEVHTIIVGGQETVASTLGYVLLMLGSHPDVQNKLYNEVKQIFEDNKSDLTKEDLLSLVYCEAVIQETLRLYPPLPVVTRHADRDLQIKSCTIPKGTLCCLNLLGAGRSHRAWGEDADKFLPERWLLPSTSSNLAYLPFSTGRRSCIGKRYATAILKTLLAYCVKDLIFVSEADKFEFKMDIVLRATKGNLLEVKLRMYYIIWTLLLLFCLQCILWSLFWKARRNFKNLPAYSQLPFLGSVHWFIGGGAMVFHRLKEISKIMDDTRLPFIFWLGPQPILFVSDPEDVKIVTNGFLEKPYQYDFGRDWLGDGLLTAPGEIWKRNIKLIAGTFSASMVDGFQQVFNIKARELVENLKADNNKQPFDAMPHLSNISLAAICQTGLGVTYTSDSKQSLEYYDAFKSTLELLLKRGLNLFYHYDCIYRFSSDYAKFLKNVAVLHNVSNTVINQKIQERNKMDTSKTHIDSTIEGPKKSSFKSILDVLLDLKEIDPNMDLNRIKSEVHTIIFGGQETVASTLGYALLMLGCHPNVQNKLYNEVKQIFEDNKSDLTKEDLSSLVYCEAVIQETLRLYPPVPIVTRHADRDVQIKSCIIPKGTLCSLHLWGAGRSHRAWGEDADKFLPERWLLPSTSSNLGYMPFSVGRRSCIGKRYAMAILKTLLAHCVKDLIFASEADKLEFQMDVVLRAIEGNLLEVKLRV